MAMMNEHEASASSNHPVSEVVQKMRREQEFHEYRYDLILKDQFKDTEAAETLEIIGDILRDNPDLGSYDNLAFRFGGLVGLRVAEEILSHDQFKKIPGQLSNLLVSAYESSDHFPIAKQTTALTNSLLGYAALGEKEASEYMAVINDPTMSVYVSRGGTEAMEDGFGLVIAAMNEVVATDSMTDSD